MAINYLVAVAGEALPEPSSYSGNTSTLVDSARNVEGKMVGSVIRDDVAKVVITADCILNHAAPELVLK